MSSCQQGSTLSLAASSGRPATCGFVIREAGQPTPLKVQHLETQETTWNPPLPLPLRWTSPQPIPCTVILLSSLTSRLYLLHSRQLSSSLLRNSCHTSPSKNFQVSLVRPGRRYYRFICLLRPWQTNLSTLTSSPSDPATMADSANAPKPNSSVKLVLLGEAAVGKVRLLRLFYVKFFVNILIEL